MSDPTALLGLPLGEALEGVRAAGLPAPRVIRTVPPRERHPFPPVESWRVVRVDATGTELVVAPPIEAPCSA